MKPASVINRGANFVTLRATTDRPAEIQQALAARGVRHVFKGDQNQGWDAVLANHCLARAVGDGGAEITFFVQDERLGTSDARLARHWRQKGRTYVLTEDYYRGRAGAVWEHQDTSYGLFYTEAVSPEQFAHAGVHLHRAAELWEKHAAAILLDKDWLRAVGALGVTFPGHSEASADRATRLGPAVNEAALAEFFADHPASALYYAFTKTDGLYGLVPVENENVLLSSIPARHPELRAGGAWLLIHTAARGALRLAGSAAHRRKVGERVRRLIEWSGAFLRSTPDASVADFQIALGGWLTERTFPADQTDLDRTSQFTRVTPEDLPRLREPADTLHFFLDLALRHPAEFTEAYNEALNQVGFGLQRVKWEARAGRFTPPFFVQFAPGGPGTPVYRYGLELSGVEATIITLANPTAGDIVLEADRRVCSVLDFCRALFEGLTVVEEISVVGKAAAFAAELQRAPRGLGLPRQGSKYTPMVDHLLAGLRQRGVLDQPTGLLIRIGLNTLDRLDAMGDLPLHLPRFLQDPLGGRASCREIARRWRAVAAEARELLDFLSRFPFGQYVHLVKAISLNASGRDWPTDHVAQAFQPAQPGALAPDPHLADLTRALEGSEQALALLGKLGRDVPTEAVACLERLTARREALLEARRAAAAAAPLPIRHSVEPEAMQEERERVECQLLLLFAAYVRRLWQRAESLSYLNDRPYSLALYLLFGPEVFLPICREVEFDVEYLSLGWGDPSTATQPAAGAAVNT